MILWQIACWWWGLKKLANKKTKKHNIQVYEELPAGDEGTTAHASSAATHYSDNPEELKYINVICEII